MGLEVLLRLIPPLLEGWTVPILLCRLECCWLHLKRTNNWPNKKETYYLQVRAALASPEGSLGLWSVSWPCLCAGSLRPVEGSHSLCIPPKHSPLPREEREPPAFLGSLQRLVTCKWLNPGYRDWFRRVKSWGWSSLFLKHMNMWKQPDYE